MNSRGWLNLICQQRKQAPYYLTSRLDWQGGHRRVIQHLNYVWIHRRVRPLLEGVCANGPLYVWIHRRVRPLLVGVCANASPAGLEVEATATHCRGNKLSSSSLLVLLCYLHVVLLIARSQQLLPTTLLERLFSLTTGPTCDHVSSKKIKHATIVFVQSPRVCGSAQEAIA